MKFHSRWIAHRDNDARLHTLQNIVGRGTLTKEAALTELDGALDSLKEAFEGLRRFLQTEPDQEEYSGLEILFGEDNFVNEFNLVHFQES